MAKILKNNISLEVLKKELRPFIRQEIERVILDLLERKYPPENKIRKSYVKRVEKIEKSVEPEIYRKEDILEL